MHKTEKTPQRRIIIGMTEHLIDVLSFKGPLEVVQSLDELFMTWNESESADDQAMRSSIQHDVRMLKDFFLLFAKSEPEEVAQSLSLILKNFSDVKEEKVLS